MVDEELRVHYRRSGKQATLAGASVVTARVERVPSRPAIYFHGLDGIDKAQVLVKILHHLVGSQDDAAPAVAWLAKNGDQCIGSDIDAIHLLRPVLAPGRFQVRHVLASENHQVLIAFYLIDVI